MNRIFLFLGVFFSVLNTNAQETYTMGYESAEIQVVDAGLFSEYQFPGQAAQCGIFDKASETFYTCDYTTFRYVDEEFVRAEGKMCCEKIDFDPSKYYGTLTMQGVIDSVEWDAMVIHFTTDKARLTIRVDEREIDMLYKRFYSNTYPGKVHLVLRLKTYDTPKENVISYNKITEIKPKPKRTFTKILSW